MPPGLEEPLLLPLELPVPPVPLLELLPGEEGLLDGLLGEDGLLLGDPAEDPVPLEPLVPPSRWQAATPTPITVARSSTVQVDCLRMLTLLI